MALARRLPLAAALVLALAGCGGSGSGGGSPVAAPPATTSAASSGSCTLLASPPPKREGHRTAPRTRLDPRRTYVATVSTNCGSFAFRLDVKDSPRTTASFVALARSGFFDGTIFHRVVPGFVIQGGDPTGTGSGGPGYVTVDPPPRTTRYTRGVVAMAKTAAEPAGASGSQFFVVTAADAQLPPRYALLGRVVRGLPVVEKIGRLGNPTTQQPTQPIVISRISIAVS